MLHKLSFHSGFSSLKRSVFTSMWTKRSFFRFKWSRTDQICNLQKKNKNKKARSTWSSTSSMFAFVISVSKILFRLKLSGIIHYQGSSLDVQNVWVTFRVNIPEYSVHIASYCIHYARFWEQKLGSYLVFSKFDTAHLPECKFVCGFSIPLISLFFPPCQSKIPISIWATRHDLNCGLWLTETQVYFKTVVNPLNLICLKKLHPQLSFVIAWSVHLSNKVNLFTLRIIQPQ